MTTDTLDWIKRDLQHFWHPCSQMKDYESFPPLIVKKAKGSYLYLENGKSLIDANSSWWCKSLGHGHPRLKKALIQQADNLEHVILANLSHETIIKLSEKLSSLTESLNKVLYASDGSSAIEMALKMSLHSRQITGEHDRKNFISLKNAYHGETSAALSVSDVGLFRKAYESLLIPCQFIDSIPYVSGKEDPLWHDCHEIWSNIETQLNQHAKNLTAIIVEPILQGVGGMHVYSQDFLRRLSLWAKEHNVHLIADEILTGLGRLGLPLACQHANIAPDFVCLGKGLTAGWLPMSATLISDSMYQLFYDDYEKGKNFLHSHTFSGNALAAAVALETLSILDEENIYLKVSELEHQMKTMMLEIAHETKKINNVRGIGGMIAADLVVDNDRRRYGYEVYRRAVELGALLRPLENTLYWLPPLNIEKNSLRELQRITERAIIAVL